jgi:RimJ/RimL family protein N-acetyltransferase
MNLPARSLTAQQVCDFWAGFDNVNRFFFQITDAAGMALGFWQVECDPLHESATFQLALDPACHGAGCATETAVALPDWLFGVRKVAKLIVMTLPDNAAMQALLARLGFVREGLMHQEIKNLTGEGRLDQLRFGLLPSGWQAARASVITHLNRRAATAPTGKTI